MFVIATHLNILFRISYQKARNVIRKIWQILIQISQKKLIDIYNTNLSPLFLPIINSLIIDSNQAIS